jgi:hypothetical protein
MKHSVVTLRRWWVLLSLIVTTHAIAGPYGDDMAKCLVKASTADDRSVFIKWLFASIALHPDVRSMATITPQQRDDFNRRAAALFQRLLTDSCRSETQLAIRYEGAAIVQYAFQVFGQAAARDLFSSGDVAAGMNDLAKYIDQEKIKALSAPEAAK